MLWVTYAVCDKSMQTACKNSACADKTRKQEADKLSLLHSNRIRYRQVA